jgi:hypothetical protein
MRLLVALAVVVALGLIGVVGFVVIKEQERGAVPSSGPSSGAAVATIARADEVDVAAHVVPSGYTVVMFTADF